MKRIKVMRLSLLSSFLLISLAVLLVFGFSVQAEHMVKAEPVPQLDDQVLEEKAIVAAQQAGLQGLPTAKRVVHMTLAEWLKLNGAELGKDAAQFALSPDMPVYVLAMRGSVISQLPVFPRPGQEGLQAPEQYDNITIVLDAKTGNLVWVVTTRPGFAMPVEIPQ